jgi:uncharacterized membrane protein
MPTTTLGYLHLVAASLSILLGAFQLIRTRRDQLHRRVGYTYVGAMAVNGITALTVYEFTGGFNIFHGLAIYSLLSIALAVQPMLANPRPLEWKRKHYMWVAWSYAGLMAAAVTEFLVRVVHAEGWLSAALGSPPVIILAAFLIPRFAPPRRGAAPLATGS